MRGDRHGQCHRGILGDREAKDVVSAVLVAVAPAITKRTAGDVDGL
jgi:hypothetical protein